MENLRRIPTLMLLVLLLRFTFALGELHCEDLTTEDCAFAVSSRGARCVLEKSTLTDGEVKPNCQTSVIMAEKPEEWIESEECIKGCGLERESYGMSTDLLLESGFAEKLCSVECKSNCPNIIDLYLKLAAGEGVYLPHLCTDVQSRSRRLIADRAQVTQVAAEGSASSTHVQNRAEPWDSSVVVLAPAPQPSSSVIYGPAPAPPRLAHTTQRKLKKPVVPLPAVEPLPAAVSAEQDNSKPDLEADFDDDDY